MQPDHPTASSDPSHPAIATGAPEHPDERAERHRRRRRRRHAQASAASYVTLLVGLVIVLFPVYLLVVDSLLSAGQIVAKPPTFFPTHPVWSNYTTLVTQYGFLHYFGNSAIQTSLIVAAQLVTSILAAYAFVFVRFPLRRTLFLLTLSTVMIPFEVTVVANENSVQHLGWAGTMTGLTVPFFATGFGIFLMRQAFLQIPRELQEAAVIDGLGPVRFLWRVAIPLARPVIAALSVFSFLGAWNQYLWPAVQSTYNSKIATLPIGLRFISGLADKPGIPIAGAVVAFLPLVILLIFFRKNLIRSLTAGAVK